MKVFPTFFRMDGAQIVVFGGGEEARRKVRLLAKTPAKITVFTGADIEPGFAEEFAGRITISPFENIGPALDVAKFVIIACRFDENMQKAYDLVRQYGLPVNVVAGQTYVILRCQAFLTAAILLLALRPAGLRLCWPNRCG